MKSFSPSVVLMPCIMAALMPAQTIVVSGGGVALQQAITTALVGAVLDVMGGTYSPVVVTRGLRISLRAGAAVTPQFPAATPGITITGLPAGEQFVLEGSGAVAAMSIGQCAGDVVVDGVNHASTFSSSMPVTVTGCTGAVIFHRTTSLVGVGVPWGRILVNSSTNVSFTACTMPCMTVTNSRVSLNGCSNRFAYASLPGIDLVSGSVVVDGGIVAGGLLYSFPIPAPGIRIAQGEVVVTGGAVIEPTPVPVQFPAIETIGGNLRLDPSVQVMGAITGPAPVQVITIPSLEVSHTANTMAVALAAEPNAVVVTFAGLPQPPMPTPWGDAWLSPLDPILDIVVLPAAGTHAFTRQFASVPPFVQLVVQSVQLSPSALTIGAPARFVWD